MEDFAIQGKDEGKVASQGKTISHGWTQIFTDLKESSLRTAFKQARPG